GGEKVHQLQFGWKMLVDVDARTTKKMQLLIKLYKISPAFMIHHSFWNQANPKAGGMDTDAILNIFTQSGELIPSYFFPSLSGNADIETTGMKLTHMLFIAPNPPRGKGRCHGITDGFLYGCEGFVCSIRPAIGI